MSHNDKILLAKMRAALQRHDCRINSRTGMLACKREIERITGKPLSDTPSMFAQQIYGFYDRTMSVALTPRPFKPLVGYERTLMRHRELCEGTR